MRALQLLAATMRPATPAPIVVPTVRGGLQLEWHQRDVDLEVEVPPSGAVQVAYENLAEGREWEALQAEARAETHAQLADDPLFKKP